MADDDGNASSKRARVDDSASTSGSDTAASRKLFGGRSPFDADHKIRRQSGMFHVLVGVTGSVATIKARELVDEIRRLAPPDSVIIKIVATKSAIHFLRGLTFEHEIIYEDEDEWSMWTGRGDPVLHIELRKWADAMVIAPLDANTMAKLANGLCDNLLTSVVRAWDPTRPLWFAPAMNTLMWESPLTFQQRKTLRDLLSFKEIPPVEKELVCGDVGAGGMAPPRFVFTTFCKWQQSDVRSRRSSPRPRRRLAPSSPIIRVTNAHARTHTHRQAEIFIDFLVRMKARPLEGRVCQSLCHIVLRRGTLSGPSSCLCLSLVSQKFRQCNLCSPPRRIMWVFGYGSLLWNAGFPFVQRIPGQVLGWERRFCQLSPDHRGTEQEPGRTVTLCQGEGPTATCWGVAYKVPEGDVSATVAYLDHREKAGYEMVELDFAPDDPKLETFRVQAYISGETSQFRAPNESDDEVAHVIVHACGPSGRNTEYLLRLADELRKAGVRDEHVEGLAELVVRKAIDERLHADLLEQYARHLGA